jgi:hypothetical protein
MPLYSTRGEKNNKDVHQKSGASVAQSARPTSDLEVDKEYNYNQTAQLLSKHDRFDFHHNA